MDSVEVARLYEHIALPEENWTRLLRLQPGNLDDLIVCDLLVTEIQTAPLFDAISYVSGDKSQTKEIIIDGHRIHVLVNLHDALQHIRKPSDTVVVWADAVCINQSNTKEFGMQVNQMGSIYRQADSVLIWVGQDTEGDAIIAKNLISDISDHFNKAYSGGGHVKDVPLLPSSSPLLDHSRWKAAQNFYLRPWFTRVWVLQEVGHAKKAVILYGQERFGWSPVVQMMLLIAERADLAAVEVYLNIGRLVDAFESIWSADFMESCWEDASPYVKDKRALCIKDQGRLTTPFKQFSNVLVASSRFLSSDPRDHVYAFLSHPTAFSKRTHKRIMNADYSLPKSDVFRRIAVTLLNEMKRLDILTIVEHTEHPDPEEIPSWVPQWDNRARGVAFYPISGILPYYNADLQEDMGAVELVHAQEDITGISEAKKALRLHGLVLGSVKAVSGVMHREDFKRKTGEIMEDGGLTNPVERAWELVEAQHFENERYLDPRQAFSLTLATGRDQYWDEAEKDLEKHDSRFRAYCRQYCNLESGLVSDKKSALDTDDRSFLTLSRTVLQSQTFFMTSDGLYGIGTSKVRVGDVYCVLFGGSTPFILRKCTEPSYYKLIGASYVHGIMRGESVREWKHGNLTKESITLL
ncbi:heterokaryon incompatibility protein-domain-containing protein [Nemania abortiva]|nr:heterokaryon incompatibility protein-domain-containing protein [Nemania abortiva]